MDENLGFILEIPGSVEGNNGFWRRATHAQQQRNFTMLLITGVTVVVEREKERDEDVCYSSPSSSSSS